MGKYNSITEFNATDAFLKAIANELAEKNRLERYKINNGYYESRPKVKPLEDVA